MGHRKGLSCVERYKAMKKTEDRWTKRWRHWIAPTKITGVWKVKEGGYLVRTRVLDPESGRTTEIRRVLPEADEASAYLFLKRQMELARAGTAPARKQMPRFADYAVSLLERKLTTREIKSARNREKWRYTLTHLIVGTKGVAGFGDMLVSDIRVRHVEAWKGGVARLVEQGFYQPTTINGWLATLLVVLRSAQREFELKHDATKGVKQIDTSEHETYTEEEPNALTEDEVKAFLDCMFDNFPQHYAMAVLGFATGLRPSSMRPLRRAGDNADVLWDKGVLLIRRSHSMAQEVMRTTKTGVRQRIPVPGAVVAVLTWHVETQLKTPEQKDSELLFPAALGGFRGPTCLRKPFAACAKAAGLTKRFTPRGLRRTFNDLARRAHVDSLVIKSVSGHLTDRMKEHYSTVGADERRDGIDRVMNLVRAESIALASSPSPSE
jgi:integrase